MNHYVAYILAHLLKLTSFTILKDEPNRYVIRSGDIKVTMHKLDDLMRIDETSDHSLTLLLNAYDSLQPLLKYQKAFIGHFFRVLRDWNKLSFTPKRLDSFTYKGWFINIYEWINGFHVNTMSQDVYYQLLDINRYFLEKYHCYICGLDNVLVGRDNKVYFIDDDSFIPVVNTSLMLTLSNIFIHDDPEGKHSITVFYHNKDLIDNRLYELADRFKYKLCLEEV